MVNKLRKFFILLSSSFAICLSCFSDVLNIPWRDEKFLRRDFAATGPIPGNPSRMNCFCSSVDLKVFV